MENKIQKLKTENRNNEEYVSKMSSEIQQTCVCVNRYLNQYFLTIEFNIAPFQENYTRELNNLFAKIDDRRRVSIKLFVTSNTRLQLFTILKCLFDAAF